MASCKSIYKLNSASSTSLSYHLYNIYMQQNQTRCNTRRTTCHWYHITTCPNDGLYNKGFNGCFKLQFHCIFLHFLFSCFCLVCPYYTGNCNYCVWSIFFSFIFSVRLLSLLCDHSVFSSPPQLPMTSDFEGFLYQILSITFIFLS